MQENVLTGGHGLMVEGYYPVLRALSKDIDIRLNHRFVSKLYKKPLIYKKSFIFKCKCDFGYAI